VTKIHFTVVPPLRSTATSQLSIRASIVRSPRHIPTVVRELSDEWSLSTRHTSHRAPSDRPPPDRSPPHRPPPSSPPILLHTGLLGYLQTHSIPASECISKLTRSQPPSVSQNFHDHVLQVHLQARTITASKCITKIRQSRP